MRGFSERTDVEDIDRLLGGIVCPLAPEPVCLLESAGRVLADDVVARVDVPGFDRAAMDGYAVRGADTFGASQYNPLFLLLQGEALPGRAFGHSLAPGQAVRIMTGAPLPDGADAVIMAERCEEREGRVYLSEAVAPRKHVGATGEDIRHGDLLLRAGRRLRPQDVGVLASIGCAEVSCVRRPRIQPVVTGDELLPAGTVPEGCRIVDSNSVMLRALIARDGGKMLPFNILRDDPDTIRNALATADADVILVSGGSSVGKEDHAPRLLAELGSLDVHGVSMRPSSPTGFGRIGDCLVFLLPGNPVSSLCAYEFFAGPSIRALGGRSRAWPHRRVRVPLARKIASAIGRTDYVRVRIEDGRASPIATSGASILSSTVHAAGAVIVPRELEGFDAGTIVEALLYDEEPTAGIGL